MINLISGTILLAQATCQTYNTVPDNAVLVGSFTEEEAQIILDPSPDNLGDLVVYYPSALAHVHTVYAWNVPNGVLAILKDINGCEIGKYTRFLFE